MLVEKSSILELERSLSTGLSTDTSQQVKLKLVCDIVSKVRKEFTRKLARFGKFSWDSDFLPPTREKFLPPVQ